MAYRLQPGESVEEGMRRIAREQIAMAEQELGQADEDLHGVVHAFRKRCKKMRGLIRLVRPEFPGYAEENAWFRDRAAELSDIRDATSMQECLAALIRRYGDDLADEAFADVREWLADRGAALDDADVRQTLERVRSELPEAAARIDSWGLEAPGAAAIEAGLRKTYKRARKSMHTAMEEPGAETFHTWRKRVKYHRYHTRLVSAAWPRVLKAVHREARRLSDVLGDDHDLAVLGAALRQEAPEELRHAALFALLDRRSAELRAWSLALGNRLYVEDAASYAARLRAYLETWQREEEEGALLVPQALRLYS
jgi:CHAD domain-containing protein